MTKDEALNMAIEALDTLMMEKGSIYQQALQACKDALEQPLKRDWKETIDERIAKDDEFKQALAQTAQEPTAYLKDINNPPFQTIDFAFIDEEGAYPVYIHPAPSWQGLSDDEIGDLITHYEYSVHPDLDGFARAIEQALKDKNT